MSQIPPIDKVQYSPNGSVELIIHQMQDWESDPMLVKRIRDRVEQYKAYLTSPDFSRQYPRRQGSVVIESVFSAPPEIQRMFGKDGVAIREPGSVTESPLETAAYGIQAQIATPAVSTMGPASNMDSGSPRATAAYGQDEINQAFALIQTQQAPPAPVPVPHIDRLQGPTNQVMELFVLQYQDWESDPLLMNKIRDKIKQYRAYAESHTFQQHYPGCQGRILLETSFSPPPEIQRILQRENVEIRYLAAPAPMPSASGNVQAAPVGTPTQAQAPQAAPAPAPSFQPKAEAPLRAPWETDDDPYDDDFEPISGSITGASRGSLITVGLLLGLSLLGLFYGAFVMSTPKADSNGPTVRAVGAVSALNLPASSHATVSVTPDRNTFVFIPIQNSNGKSEYRVMFAAKENRKLLIYAPRAQSQVLARVNKKVNAYNPDLSKVTPVWEKDLDGPKPRSRTYTGSLDKLQRQKGGPIELMIGDEYMNVNKIPGLGSTDYPMDTMVLRVGETPKLPESYKSVVITVSLLFSLLFGLIFFVMLSRSRHSSF